MEPQPTPAPRQTEAVAPPPEPITPNLEISLLDPGLSLDQVAKECRIAREAGIAAVIVRPCDVDLAVEYLKGSRVTLASVAGHPYGTGRTAAKLYEVRDLLRAGAREIEFVLNPARMISRDFPAVETELQQVAESCAEHRATLKIVYNNTRLSDDHKIIATKICRRVGAGFLSLEHSEPDLALLRPLLKDTLLLKRATPVSTYEEAAEARSAGYVRMLVDDVRLVLEQERRALAPPASSQPAPS
jgi:deoxyribose-phosphate aldolase